MTYYNPILRYGLKSFCSACANSGIDGLIVPDLPPEESVSSGLDQTASEKAIQMVCLLSPTSTMERIRIVAQKSSGFIYLVSVAGVTGARTNLPTGIEAFIKRVRQVTSKPLCVGFGISTPQQAGQVSALADGVIIGSKLIQLMKEDPSLDGLRIFTKKLRAALDTSSQAKP